MRRGLEFGRQGTQGVSTELLTEYQQTPESLTSKCSGTCIDAQPDETPRKIGSSAVNRLLDKLQNYSFKIPYTRTEISIERARSVFILEHLSLGAYF